MDETNKNILYLSYDGMTEPLGQSQVLPYLINLSKQDGYTFILISFEKPDKYKEYRNIIESICAKNKIEWIPMTYTKSPPILSTIYDTIRMQRKAQELFRKKPYVLVHARGGYVTSLVALSLKKKYHTKYIFDMRGFWADERVDGNLWKLNNPLYKAIYQFFKRKEVEFLENADEVITLTHSAQEEIHTWKNIRNNPVSISVIPCCVDMKKFCPDQVDLSLKDDLTKQLRLKTTDYILLYLGSLGTWYLLDEMLDFFKVLLAQKPTAKFLFVTNDPEEGIMNKAIEKGIDKNSVIIAHASFDKIPTYISLADASVFFIKPAYSKKGSSPIKQGELMSMGIPVICNSNVGDTEWIVRKYESGVVVDTFDAISYKKAVSELSESRFNNIHIINGATDYFSLEVGGKKYLAVYQKLLG